MCVCVCVYMYVCVCVSMCVYACVFVCMRERVWRACVCVHIVYRQSHQGIWLISLPRVIHLTPICECGSLTFVVFSPHGQTPVLCAGAHMLCLNRILHCAHMSLQQLFCIGVTPTIHGLPVPWEQNRGGPLIPAHVKEMLGIFLCGFLSILPDPANFVLLRDAFLWTSK